MDIIQNIIDIRNEHGISQEFIANAMDVDTAVVSRIERRKRSLKVNELEIIANALGEDILYLLTYPHRYVKKESENVSVPVETILQIKLHADKCDQILKLVFGEQNMEIINK